MNVDISILIFAFNEKIDISSLIRTITVTLFKISQVEIIAIVVGSHDKTIESAIKSGAKTISLSKVDYGQALEKGFKEASGDFILTMRADLLSDPEFVSRMWNSRNDAEVIVASRYIKNGGYDTSFFSFILSRLLNKFFEFGLAIPVHDITGDFRLYRRDLLKDIKVKSRGLSAFIEILLKAYAKGYKIKEVPFHYRPRIQRLSCFRLIQLGIQYIKGFFIFWNIRNSIYCADYDERAFYSRIFFQRYWQRQRHKIILGFLGNNNIYPVVDVGCGSSKIIAGLPQAVAVDMNFSKLRYIRKTNYKLIQADIKRLPFKYNSFTSLICSQVIEHVNEGNTLFRELSCLLRPYGILIIGTPDYDRVEWRVLEKLYGVFHRGGYADEHISHYTFAELKEILLAHGFRIIEHRYICRSELIIKAEKI